ncbi:TonB-dependent receptor [Aurantibacillus circumpalustris]|uniref:TonB-dependent receptor n=1 Tax=Aurantibacillus circumpalustris TaxID=3036359 RepID=UPI00295B8AFB|nr:carboxypeptidase-like regulatory domain-containing protein [Aurantibacillus circumpalustris]
MRSIWIGIFILLCSLPFFSQTGTVKGFVYDKANGEPVPFSNVYFKGTTIGANTDINGFFSINRIPPGNYILIAVSLDFDTIQEPVNVTADNTLNKKIFVVKGGVKLDEVEINTTSAEKIENTSVGVQKIDPIVINKLPSVGEPDIAQYLQVLPGVVFTGDQGGQLYIRGGLPVQNKVLLDGLIIYNPFHSIGLFSVFDSDIMKNADVYSAGFGAEYGGRTSSIMDITTRDGNKKHGGGKISASTFGAKAMLEGPFVKLKENGNTSASYILSMKHSYLPQTSKSLYSYANPNGLPFYYTDVYGKASINSTGGSKISLFGFSFNDKVNYSDIASFNWNNTGAGVNFLLVPQSSNLLVEGLFAYSKYDVNFTNPSLETDSKNSGVSGINTGFNFVKFLGKQELRFGFEGVITNTKFDVQNPYFAKITLNRSTTDIAGFIKYKFIDRKKRLVFEPSFRMQYYATLGVASPEPRASLKFNFTKKIRFKAAGGFYSQTLMSANSDRDIVNLFYGFINAPENEDISNSYLDNKGVSQNVNSSVQKATHMVGGFELDLFKHFELNIEVYQKFFNQVININRDKVFEDNTTNALRPDDLKKNFVIEQGRARGFDVVLKYDRKRFYFWAVYSLTFNDRWVGTNGNTVVTNYAPNFDRRHNVNLVTSYSFGKKKQWELNGRWNFGTGFPFTPTQGYINQLNPQGNINYNFNTGNGTLNYIPGDLNSSRLPDYHRFDIGVKYKYKLSEKTTLEINFGATNIYNRENIFYVDRFTFKRINQLPIMPNLNVSLTF